MENSQQLVILRVKHFIQLHCRHTPDKSGKITSPE